MKVIHIISGGDVGGAKTHVLSLVKALSSDVTVRLACLREGEFAEDARRLGIDTVIVHNGGILRDVKVLSQIIRRECFNIIHCHGSKANVLGALLKRRTHLPVITSMHSDYRLDYLGRPLRALTFGTMNAIALRRMDYYVCVSGRLRAEMAFRGFSPQRILQIHNGMDFGIPLKAPENREDFLRRLGLDIAPGDIVCCILARLVAVKDVETLIRAFATAIKIAPNLKLVIAGDGEQREMLERLSHELSCADKLSFAGWVSNTESLLACADVNLLTSISEGFPYVVLEGARGRCATVVSNVGDLPELIRQNVTGLLFEPRDHTALTRHLISLAKDGELRKRLADNLYNLAREEFSLEGMKEKQIGIYNTVLRRADRAGKRSRDGAVICGSYGVGNTGDDGILSAVLDALSRSDPDLPLWVLSKRPKNIIKNNMVKGIYSFNLLALIRFFRRTRLYINGGGTLIQNATSNRSLFYYLFTLWLAKVCGARVMMYGCGIGPITGALQRKITGRVINSCAEVITLRDDTSLAELRRLSVTRPEIILSSDPAIGLKRAPEGEIAEVFSGMGADISGDYLCFAPRDWRGFDAHITDFAKVAEYFYENHGLTPVFLPMEYPADLSVCRKIAEMLRCPYFIFDLKLSIFQTAGVVAKMRALIGMRLHSLIFAASAGVPLVGVSYDVKVDAFLKYIGQELLINLNESSFERLKELTCLALSQSHSGKRAEELARREHINVDTAMRLINEERI